MSYIGFGFYAKLIENCEYCESLRIPPIAGFSLFCHYFWSVVKAEALSFFIFGSSVGVKSVGSGGGIQNHVRHTMFFDAVQSIRTITASFMEAVD
jgi:hypothetical protein